MSHKSSDVIKNWFVDIPADAPPPPDYELDLFTNRSIWSAKSAVVYSNPHITTSSNAVLVPHKASNDDVSLTSRPEGFAGEDEDDSDKHQHALSSPIKGNQGHNSTVSPTISSCTWLTPPVGHHQCRSGLFSIKEPACWQVHKLKPPPWLLK